MIEAQRKTIEAVKKEREEARKYQRLALMGAKPKGHHTTGTRKPTQNKPVTHSPGSGVGSARSSAGGGFGSVGMMDSQSNFGGSPAMGDTHSSNYHPSLPPSTASAASSRAAPPLVPQNAWSESAAGSGNAGRSAGNSGGGGGGGGGAGAGGAGGGGMTAAEREHLLDLHQKLASRLNNSQAV